MRCGLFYNFSTAPCNRMNKYCTQLFSLLMLFCMHATAQHDSIQNLVFEGAGIRGMAYSGAIAELESRGLLKNMKRVGGTSAGAITALMLCLNYSAAEITTTINSTPFQKFNSGRFFFPGGIHRVKKNFGWYRSTRFEHWFDAIIAAKTGNAAITFAGLKESGYKDLYVTGTDLTQQKAVLLSQETFPQMRVRDAVKISMSIPLYFEAVFMKDDGMVVPHPKSKNGLHVLADGGFVANFPIAIWDSSRYVNATGKNIFLPNHRTIGFRIDSDTQLRNDSTGAGLAPLPILNFKQYLTAFYTIILENLNRQTLTREDWQRTVSISDGGLSPRIRRLSRNEVETLVRNGRNATAAFLKSSTH